ncbi:hypothetical protein K2Z84_05245 [Candidatus Binatia bacterium]|nr:hypothetical protein [Candidatus Binatia bacterium]
MRRVGHRDEVLWSGRERPTPDDAELDLAKAVALAGLAMAAKAGGEALARAEDETLRRAAIPTVPGYYIVRWRSRFVRAYGYDATPQIARFELRTDYMEDDEPDAPKVWLTGSDVDREVDDFEWLEGPLKLTA